MRLSLCMIVRDEEEVLARCLGGVRGVIDELVVVDTGSSDATPEIARSFGADLCSFPWRDDFSAARNFAFSRATGDYLLWLDADDVVGPEEAERLAALKPMLERDPYDMVSCLYETGGMRFYRERILRREAGFRWVGRVHECIPPRGRRMHYPFLVRHLRSGKPRGDRNLRIYRAWEREETLGGRDLFYFGRELYYNGLYAEAEQKLCAMLAGEGWYVNKIEACGVLADCRLAQGKRELAKEALLASLRWGEPRAALLCKLGFLFKEEKRYREAAFWFESATHCRDHTAEGDFEFPDCRTVVPALELVVCLYALGDREGARLWHEKAEAFAPAHPSVLFNRRFFGKPSPPA